ncbi:outer membrane protein, cobalt-zinc-cadmium efflux system [Nannocystis exedens]|uniref:Outer membrane protein, cobalt-zinc-cadmium efflux system n=2 Tax=Nannocystis exedens TaxID=54 RepID=A0A1I1U109_9BACT|nr:Cobalt-zinc-cadmium resistance protein CzcC precursor [Nannocystis exedens]SFD64502.1 outer membrane protein, cobalt-zinc-cadmium efflux system [Nannocystis exedens]
MFTLVAAVTAASLAPAAGAAPAPARKPADAPAPLLAPMPEPAQTIPEPVVAGAQVLPLDTILKHAEENAMPVRTARSRLELGDAAITGAKPLLPDNPQLYLGMGARLNPAAGSPQFELQATLQQPIEIGRERSLRIKAGREYREYLDKELAQVRWTTHAQVHYAYNTALIAKERARTAARTQQFAERLLDIASRRQQAGEISRLRVRVAEGELARARQAKLAADLNYRLACIHLAEMAGWPSGQLIAPAGELGDPIKVRDPEDLIANVQKEHPALKAKEAQVELGEARAKSARRDRLPEPWIGVYVGREREPGVTLPASRIVLGMITIPLPFFKRNQLARAQTKAELGVANTELEVTRYQLALNARRAVDAINTAAERVQTYSREVVPRFEENLQLLQRAFELGEVDIIEVFVARENFLRIQTEALDAYGTYFDAMYTLETIIGQEAASLAAARPTRASTPPANLR